MQMQMFCAVAFVLSLKLSAAWRDYSYCWVSDRVKTCSDCIQVSKSCAWCSDESFQVDFVSDRCGTVKTLLSQKCPLDKIINPPGAVSIEKNLPVSNNSREPTEKLKPEQVIHIQPQKINLSLRKGESQTFSLKFKRPEDYPIDLYYLMDLSSSMKDHLENLKSLGTSLVEEMKKISSDFRIGFGLIEQINDPQPVQRCQSNCPGVFSFKNILKLTDRADQFSRALSQLQIYDSMDSTQTDLRYIQQVALCEEQIGWRDATRFLVLSTDSGFSLSTGWSPEPQSTGQCRLENNTYTREGQSPQSSIHVFDLARSLSDHNIQTIFTVTENVLPLYPKLTEHIPKTAVRTLSSNSSNVLELIMDAVNSLSSEVVLENSRLPDGMWISHKSLCKTGVGLGGRGRECSNISVGDEVSFVITMAAQKCPVSHSQTEVVKIKPWGFKGEVEVALTFLCECDCSAQAEAQSDRCNGSGTFQCGGCRCPDGRIGQQCECDTSVPHPMDYKTCRKDNSSDWCSNDGDCVCGKCRCKKRENPEERYSGQFCECDNFNCERSNNKLCGGHGECVCRQCICDANYTGSACDCSLDVTPCVATNGQICNGQGSCHCGVCKCTNPKYQGATCEMCPTCPGVCTISKPCVQCRAFGSGEKAQSCDTDCGHMTLTKLQSRSDLPWDHDVHMFHCKERDDNDCWFYYAIYPDSNQVHVVKTLDCPTVWDSLRGRDRMGLKNRSGLWLSSTPFGITFFLIIFFLL